jgi:hypothetical protein
MDLFKNPVGSLASLLKNVNFLTEEAFPKLTEFWEKLGIPVFCHFYGCCSETEVSEQL